MTPPNDSGSRPSPAGSASVDPSRQQAVGILVVVVAVLLGAILLFRGLSSTDEVVTGPVTEDGPATTVDRDAPPPTEPIDEPTAPPPADIAMAVINASGAPGKALDIADTYLEPEGFNIVGLGNFTSDESVSASSVYFVTDADQPAADLVAASLPFPTRVVVLPDGIKSAPVSYLDGVVVDPDDLQVLVVVGVDAANVGADGE